MRTRMLAAIAVTVLAVAACTGGGTTASPAGSAAASGGAADAYIPVISKGFQHQFWQAVKQGSEKAATEFGVTITFEGPATEAEVDKQIEMLQAALDKKPSAICFAALDSQAATPLLERAKSENIPVIGFDSGVDSDIPVTTAATDNIAAAGEAAKRMATLIGDAGEVAVVAHDQTSRTGIDRVKGFTDEITNNHPNITIVDTQYGGGDQLKSTDIAKTIIQAHPNLKGFFGANEGSAIGVLNGVTESEQGRRDHRHRVRLGQGPDRRHQERRHGRRNHPGSDRDRLQVRRIRRQGAQGRDAAQEHRYRLPLVRQDQRRRSRDRGAALPVAQGTSSAGAVRQARAAPFPIDKPT